jgi:ligand-binding sensor domain-containing protein/signal transduction histidine kinase
MMNHLRFVGGSIRLASFYGLLGIVVGHSLASTFAIQDYTFERISQEHGLSQSTVYAILQDSRGFMWFGTQDGLNRYDGYNFVVYKHSQVDSNSLSDNWILCIYEERSQPGVLWVGTQNGLNRFDTITNRFIRFKHDPDDTTSLSHNFVRAICEGSAGGLWIGTDGGGLNRFDRQSGRFKRYQSDPKNPSSLGNNRITSIYEDDEGLLWIGTLGGGLNCLDPRTEKFIHYLSDPENPESISSNHVMCIYRDPDREATLWVGTYSGGLNRFDLHKKICTRFEYDATNSQGIGAPRVFSIRSDKSGILWLGTFEGGVNRFDPENNLFTHFKNDPLQPQSLSANFVRSLFIDQSGNLWAGTHLGGLNKIDLKPKKFLHYQHDPADTASLRHNIVNAISEDVRGNLWVGTNIGLDKLPPGGRAFEHVALNPKSAPGKDSYVTSIWLENSNTIWIGTIGEGLLKYNPTTSAIKYFKNDPLRPMLSDNRVNALYHSRKNMVWVGTWNGLNVFDLAAGTFRVFRRDPQNSNSLGHNEILCISEDRHGNLWVGTNGGGLNKYDPASGRFTRFTHDAQVPGSLSHDIVNTIFEDADGTLWVGTSDGLNRFDEQYQRFTNYFEEDGLPNNKICAILGDEQGHLWISTWGGIARFSPQLPHGRQFRNYDQADGLQGKSFREGAAYRSPTGETFFGGIHGLNRFFPEHVLDTPAPPRVVITTFKVFDQTAKLDTSISAIKTITLSYRDDFFSFEFVALDYTSPEANRYAYKMEGFDGNWIYSGTRRYASYTNLNAGEYVFRVKGSNKDGIWNNADTSIRIIITPPFWESWWFRLLAAMAFVGMLAAIYRYRVSHLLAVERLRVRIASDLHDDIGATLTKISLQSELIQDGACSPEIIASLRKIGAMSRELVTTMSDVVWSIDARNDTAGDLLDRMRDFAASVLSVKPINVSFEVSGLDEQKKLSVPLRQNLYLIFKEAVNNIAKHAAASQVNIHIKNADGAFSLMIRDDGKAWGEGECEKLTGHGLRNMKMRAERIGGHLEIFRNGGCTVKLTAPALR